MKITKEQCEFLNSLKCSRICEEECNKNLLYEFENKRGFHLIDYLQRNGEKEDLEDITAFYIVRNAENFPLLFFSLKCGALFEPFIVTNLEEEINLHKGLLSLLDYSDDVTNPAREQLSDLIHNLAVKYNQSPEEITFQFRKNSLVHINSAKEYKKVYKYDLAKEKNTLINRVHKTYPGVEICHLCGNDNARAYWKQIDNVHPMGEVLFWWFIVPKLVQIKKIAGCSYAYLFAADASDDMTLINYYNVALKFERLEGIGTDKPRYDFCCDFLAQKINKLIDFRKEYFENFNIDDSFEII